MHTKHKLRKFIVILFLTCATAAVLIFLDSAFHLEVSRYTIPSEKLEHKIRIVQLSDLHNRVFGKENKWLQKKIGEQEPDLIFLTGDLLNGKNEETETVTECIQNLAKIAPVYLSNGNHEIMYQENYNRNLTALYEKSGAKVLEKSYVDATVNGQSVRIGGIFGYCLPEKFAATGESVEEECAFLKKFQNTDRCTLLLCHMPVAWILNDGLDDWKVNVVFSGHAQGGEVVIPGIGGMFAPDMGWFPGRLEGLFYSKDREKVLVLSRGLGMSGRIPRFCNRPEIVTVDITPAN